MAQGRLIAVYSLGNGYAILGDGGQMIEAVLLMCRLLP
jgi:hypothetical protein